MVQLLISHSNGLVCILKLVQCLLEVSKYLVDMYCKNYCNTVNPLYKDTVCSKLSLTLK